MANRKAKRRRQKKRKQARKVVATTPAPTPEAVTHWVVDYLPGAWAASVEAALAHVSRETGQGYVRAMQPALRCEQGAVAADAIGLCLTAREHLATPDRVAEARFSGPGRGIVAIWDGYPPNPGVIVHELRHLITGDIDHAGPDWESIREYEG